VVVSDGTDSSLVNTSTITVTPVNDAPVTDLNGATGGDDATATFTEDAGAILIASAGTITDVDDTNMESMTITLTNRPDGNAAESLSLNAAAAALATTDGLTVAYDSTTGVLTTVVWGFASDIPER